jgi:F-type H+-transporting ATPase subunit epsilon
MTEFELRIITPERIVFSGTVTSLIAPGELGYLGVLAHHAPLITTLKQGRITVKRNGEEQHFSISSGILEVSRNVATILTEQLTTDAETARNA